MIQLRVAVGLAETDTQGFEARVTDKPQQLKFHLSNTVQIPPEQLAVILPDELPLQGEKALQQLMQDGLLKAGDLVRCVKLPIPRRWVRVGTCNICSDYRYLFKQNELDVCQGCGGEADWAPKAFKEHPRSWEPGSQLHANMALHKDIMRPLPSASGHQG